jgi:hypothetical protein
MPPNIFLYLLICASVIFSQSKWDIILPPIGLNENKGLVISPPDIRARTDTSISADRPRDVVCEKGKLVKAGGQGPIPNSQNGQDWSLVNFGSGYSFWAIAYGNGRFEIAGHYAVPSEWKSAGVQGVILTSPDAINWTRINSGTIKNLNSVAFGNNKFVAVGNDAILVSQADDSVGIKKFPISRTPDGRIKFTLADNGIVVHMPFSTSSTPAQIELFNCSGKRILKTSVTVQNGILNIPTMGLPAGNYVFGIRVGCKDQVRSSFTLER